MCQMIAAGLGIGVVPLAACLGPVRTLGLHAIRLRDAWSARTLMLACKSRSSLQPASRLLMDRLLAQSASD
jgi:DNA-binding transcriptional LysR family regulator